MSTTPTATAGTGHSPLLSMAEIFKALPVEVRKARLASLTDEEAEVMIYDWAGWWARPSQLPPTTEWTYWLVMAGRGFGKTRIGAEQVRVWAKDFPYVNLVGATADDVRDIMVDGESGILAICPKGERPTYVASKRRLEWPNGSRSLLFSAEEPERLRGKQHFKLWGDELAAWRYAEAWDQAAFGLRLGKNPQAVVTTTPKPTKLVKELKNHKACVVTRGTTYDNRTNLAQAFYAEIITKYEGTRLGRQELNAELLEDNPGALFHLVNIDQHRVRQLPKPEELGRIVVPVDPAVTSKDESAEWGIGAVARDRQNPPHFYVFEDKSDVLTPDAAGQAIVRLFKRVKADRVVGEVNNGGDLVEAIVRHVNPNVAFKAVHASRGKAIRAEPVAALYEQGRVHHVGTLSKLEDQMCDFNPLVWKPSDPSPDRMDMVVWGITELADGFGDIGLVQYQKAVASGAIKEVKPQPSTAYGVIKMQQASGLAKVEVAADKGKVCESCGSHLVVKAGVSYRCNACGVSWADGQVSLQQARR